MLAATGILRAQTTTGGVSFLDIISSQKELGFTITQNYEYDFASDLQGNYNGDLASNVFTTAIDYATYWDRGFWRVGFAFEYTDWQWGGPTYLNDTYEMTLQTIFGQRFVDSDWGMFAVLGATLGAEYDGGNLAGGGSYRAGVGVTYFWGELNSFSLGVMAIGQEQREMYALPLPILNWYITDDLILRTFNGFTLSYDVSGDMSTVLDFTTEYENDLFRMKTQTLAPGLTRTPVAETESIVVAGGVTQRFENGLYIRGYLKGILYRKFEFRQNQSTYQSIKTDPALAIGIQGGWNF
ncbi:hypothetical protein GCM10007047_23850 [Cerasicoccus arenae]|uniref:Uncharacterized protein n=2 Tax=Cerasicoccus arenae TaxID=424488 RepID=A0A8J3DCN1_9BACT|nr:hypothetical protein GCM10007047_23850 [Cerasicoccus arenae]